MRVLNTSRQFCPNTLFEILDISNILYTGETEVRMMKPIKLHICFIVNIIFAVYLAGGVGAI